PFQFPAALGPRPRHCQSLPRAERRRQGHPALGVRGAAGRHRRLRTARLPSRGRRRRACLLTFAARLRSLRVWGAWARSARLSLELAINIKTAFYVSQAAIPALRDRGGGAIVNFTSAAVLKPQSQLAAYTAAKAAVAGLTRALAKELRDDGIRVNAVAPGTMKTADNLAQMSGAKVRWVELDELAAAVLYLASDDARGVSGEILAVTGRDV